MEAAHTPDPMSKAMGSKAADYNEIPLCHHHHDIQTRKGWSAIGLTREAAQKMSAEYWRAWPGRIAYERPMEIGRASGRARVCKYGRISVVAVSVKKKTTMTQKDHNHLQ